MPTTTSPEVLRARNAVVASFFFNGFGFASWASRIPDIRAQLSLSNTELGLLLVTLSAASVVALPTTGALVRRWGAAHVVRAGAVALVCGMVGIGVAVGWAGSLQLTGAALVVCGFGIAVWDVAMNIEGAAVEQGLGRSIMPRFHAAWSIGSVAGALVGALAVAVGVPLVWHLAAVGAVMAVGALPGTAAFLPARVDEGGARHDGGSVLAAWREPRTLLIGLMMLSLALTEGTANDWLAVALIDGYDLPHWAGVAGFGVFVSAMTTGRFVGPLVLDRHGRVPVLWTTMAMAAVGVLLTVLGGTPALALVGVVLWGLGASLGFPVGISAASDDPSRAPARVSVVTTIAYGAFLAGPPFLGFLAEHVGTLRALLVIAILLVPSALVIPVTREPSRASGA